MGYRLRMSDEIRMWLADLSRDQPQRARLVGRALIALIHEGASLGPPLVRAASGPLRSADPLAALDEAYQDRLVRTAEMRHGLAAAATLATDIERHAAGLAAERERSEARRQKEAAAGHAGEAAAAESARAHAAAQIAELEQLLPRVRGAEQVLAARHERLQARLDAFRIRRETLKARYAAAEAARAIREIIAASDALAAERWQQRADPGAAPPPDGPREIIEQIEAELGPSEPPYGLMELRPAALTAAADGGQDDIVALFAVEPPGTALLIAVLDGSDAVRDRYRDAIGICSVILRRVRDGQDPDASACAFDDESALIGEFFPGGWESPGGERPGGEVLAATRSRLGYSRQQIAARMGVPERRVAAIERAGPGAVEVADLAAYIEALGGSLSVVADVGGERISLGHAEARGRAGG